MMKPNRKDSNTAAEEGSGWRPPRPTKKADTKQGVRHSGKKKHSPKNNPPRECDFYQNPTILSRLILHGHYQAAIERVHKFSEEAAIWVCRVRTTESGKPTVTEAERLDSRHHDTPLKNLVYNPFAEPQVYYSYRQLPVHIACQQVQLFPRNSRLVLLLLKLITTYPAGCSHPDHSGQTPLQLVLRLRSSDAEKNISLSSLRRIVVMLLTVAPRTVDDVCVDTQQDERIKQLVGQGREYWERVRQRAIRNRRRKQKNNETTTPTIWSEGQGSRHSVRLQGMTLTEDVRQWGDPEELPWSQVERRCELLEGLLAQAYVLLSEQGISPSGDHGDDPSTADLAKDTSLSPLDKGTLIRENKLLKEANALYKRRIELLEQRLRDEDPQDTLSTITTPQDYPPRTMVPGRFDSMSTIPVDIAKESDPVQPVPENPPYNEFELDTVLAEAELWNGHTLLPEVVHAWNAVEIPSTNSETGGGAQTVASANGRRTKPNLEHYLRHERNAAGVIVQSSRYMI